MTGCQEFTTPAPADVAAIEALAEQARAHDGRDPLNEQVRLALKHGAPVHLLADRVGGELAGFALLHGLPAERGTTQAVGVRTPRDGSREPAELTLAVAPRFRREGRGDALVRSALTSYSSLLAWSHGGHPAAARLAARHGFERVRELWVMRRPTRTPLSEPPMREDVEIRTYRPEDSADLLRVNAAAFAGHPEQGSMDAADLARRTSEPWFDPDGLFLARDATTGELLGFHWTKVHTGPEPVGEVYVIGIAPAAQGRGLGRLLTLTGLRHLVRAGVAEVVLYVEADNAAAVAVYSGLGFTHAAADTDVQYRRG